MDITRLLRYAVVVPLCEIESTRLLSGMSLFQRIFRKFPRFLNFGMLTFSEGGVGELPSHFVAASRHIPKVSAWIFSGVRHLTRNLFTRSVSDFNLPAHSVGLTPTTYIEESFLST